MEFFEPTSVQEAVRLLDAYGESARPVAGGTFVSILLKQGLAAPSCLVSLGRVPGLDAITFDPHEGLRLGALVTHRAVERSPLVRSHLPVVADAFHLIANVRIRNVGTVGGNLCEADYASDPPPVLTALGAEVVAVGPGGARTIPAESFIVGHYQTALAPNELLVEVRIPPPGANCRATYVKHVSRSSEDRPCIGVAAALWTDAAGRCQSVRVAVGAVADTVQRVPEAEAMARGEALTPSLARAIAERYARAVEPIADLRGSAWYRREMVRVFVRRALERLIDAEG